jgi:pre-rRNA-processing protein TSR3
MNQSFPKTIIIRHRRENLKKCSLRGLESREDLCFLTYPQKNVWPDFSVCVLLTLEAPLLTPADSERPLLLLDGTWRYADKMCRVLHLEESMLCRSLAPDWKTAYPRRQEDCSDPVRGLASVEALFAAYLQLKRNPEGLLDYYYWKETFLEINAPLLRQQI